MPAVESHAADDVLFITFSRPAQLNALTVADLAEITALVTNPAGQIRALVFTGAGSRSFSAGLHVDTFTDLGPASAGDVIGQVRDCLAAVRTTPLPTAAMINGYCLGAAFELALACDLRVATEEAQFGLPEVKVGIPSVADAALLAAFVGLGRAKEIILTGDLYPAADLDRWGLLNRVVPRADLEAETLGLLSRITRHTRTVLASQKRLFEVWQNTPLSEGIRVSTKEFAQVFEAPETLQQVHRYRSSIKGAGRAAGGAGESGVADGPGGPRPLSGDLPAHGGSRATWNGLPPGPRRQLLLTAALWRPGPEPTGPLPVSARAWPGLRPVRKCMIPYPGRFFAHMVENLPG
jgi:enoyl-CoA hydratase